MTIHMTNDGSNSVQNIVILGGGTAGWLTACHLAMNLLSNPNSEAQITLLESPNVPTVGVGEGSIPSIIDSLRKIGISETDLIQQADATFKQSVLFTDWKKPSNGIAHSYHHIFDGPSSEKELITKYWAMGKLPEYSFVDAVSRQGHICNQNLAPKLITMPQYQGIAGYAYHFDAAKLVALLAKHATQKLGVVYKSAELVKTVLQPDNSIRALITDQNEEIRADLFVDCSGFSSLLLGKALGVKFNDQSKILLTDSAITTQIPYKDDNTQIPSYTKATAKPAGWIWDIALSSRRGVGHVYSSNHTSELQAEDEFRQYLRLSIGDVAEQLNFRKLSFNVGYRHKAWYKNCVAIGLSQGFVEPLEATGILMADDAAKALAELLPNVKQNMSIAANKFNQIITYKWQRIIDFIKLHYYLSDRDDSDFWLDNRSSETTPDSLLDNLSLWRTRMPSEYDFSSRHEIFYQINYFYILYGMGYLPSSSNFDSQFSSFEYERVMQMVEAITSGRDRMLEQLPSHKTLLDRIKRYGLQRI